MEDWSCARCSEDTQKEYYMIHDHLWDQYGAESGLLCVGCLEDKMGRELWSGDFTHCALNVLNMGWEKSDRLLNRLTSSENPSEVRNRCVSWDTRGGREL